MLNFNSVYLIDLVENKIKINDVSFAGIKMGSHFTSIDIAEITDIYIINPLIEGYNYECSNFTITERYEKLYKYNGTINLAGGLSFIIRNELIEGFRVSRRYIESIKDFTRREILDYHGEPDFELEDITPWGFEVDNYILCYESKKINFFIDPDKSTLTALYTECLDKSHFKLRERETKKDFSNNNSNKTGTPKKIGLRERIKEFLSH